MRSISPVPAAASHTSDSKARPLTLVGRPNLSAHPSPCDSSIWLGLLPHRQPPHEHRPAQADGAKHFFPMPWVHALALCTVSRSAQPQFSLPVSVIARAKSLEGSTANT
eukprot:scaffold23633_cov75-Phaeocystis_antarctica.AAC.3